MTKSRKNRDESVRFSLTAEELKAFRAVHAKVPAISFATFIRQTALAGLPVIEGDPTALLRTA